MHALSLAVYLQHRGAANDGVACEGRFLLPLRTMRQLPQLRGLVEVLLEAVPMLSNVIMFCAFIFGVFAILGMQVFRGILRGRCYDLTAGTTRGDACSQGGGEEA